MPSLLRSAEMNYYRLLLPAEAAYPFIRAFAQSETVMFEDLNRSSLAKPFAPHSKRVEELLVKVEETQSEMRRQGVAITEPESYEQFDTECAKQFSGCRDQSQLLEQVEEEVGRIYAKVRALTENRDELRTRIERGIELRETLLRGRDSIGYGNRLLELSSQHSYLHVTAGVVASAELTRFFKLLFRITMGNCYYSSYEMPTGPDYDKARSVFLIIYQSGELESVRQKIVRLCDSFSTSVFRLPLSFDDYDRELKAVEGLITDCKHLLAGNLTELRETLLDYAALVSPQTPFSLCCYHQLFLHSEALVYQELNKLEHKQSILAGAFWAPAQEESDLFNLLGSLQRARPSSAAAKFYRVEPEGTPPTHFELNQFTTPFQEIVNTYGIPRYGEVNPALFAAPFFPFLFGVMFGDIGHGGALLAFAIYLCRNESEVKRSDHPLRPLASLRYLLLLMGIFALFSGFIYNDFVSLPLNIFGSCYENDHEAGVAHKEEGCVYPFGFDPKWYRAENELGFFNSFKMKLAVILGVLQMSIGVFLKMLNTVHFGAWLDFVFEWLPQQVFLASTFGYMCLMIVKKWTIPWGEVDTALAPSIINQMIDLPLKLGSTSGKPLWTEQGQEDMQRFLLQLSVLMVPLILFPKPLILYFKNTCLVQPKPADEDDLLVQELRESFVTEDSAPAHKPKGHHGHAEEFEFGEIFVHQMIETIEFVLGSISNTASYLRLWALSLAHSQLAKVFFEKTLGGGVKGGSLVALLVGWALFINITFGVIMCMDMMECFLHALRLQWVQFQSKFFKADGWKFLPCSVRSHIRDKLTPS